MARRIFFDHPLTYEEVQGWITSNPNLYAAYQAAQGAAMETFQAFQESLGAAAICHGYEPAHGVQNRGPLGQGRWLEATRSRDGVSLKVFDHLDDSIVLAFVIDHGDGTYTPELARIRAFALSRSVDLMMQFHGPDPI